MNKRLSLQPDVEAGALGGDRARSRERNPVIGGGSRGARGTVGLFSSLREIPIGKDLAPLVGACNSASQRVVRASVILS